ncbi:hypothetical protein DL765_001072 [Monosporascus sp. GIB2]|nr:hypothetical protein DL765_001072 [Monosporascus sp. GIB2]
MSSHQEDYGMVFNVVRSVAEGAARVGRLALPKSQPVDTPNFFGLTSRGAVPHVTPDVLAKHTQFAGSYMALEDFMETSPKRVSPAIFNITVEGKSPLEAFTAMPPSMTTVLGARRHPAVTAPMGNGQHFISIYTSTGFQQLKNEAYCQAIRTLKPDIAIPLADLTFGYGETKQKIPNAKRQLRMVERTEEWLAQFFEALNADESGKPSDIHVFAPLLPVPYSMQWDYLNRLAEDHINGLSGLAVYDTDILPDLADYSALQSLPRLSLDFLVTPQEILRQVRLGVDIFTVPFVNTISDAGVALTFSFPPPSSGEAEKVLPLGIDMWPQDHQVSLMPLKDGCGCYACTKHHRAYLQHLLNAKEMLGWTLLQIHNHYVVSEFFAGIRSTIAAEPSTFEENVESFFRVYDSELPKGTGERPRARGYHFKAEGGQPKINRPAWEKYDADGREDPTIDAEMAGLAVTGAAAEGTETPVVPEANSQELHKKGFAVVNE